MAAAQLAARPYGSFRFRNDYYHHNADVSHLPAGQTFITSARQRPPTATAAMPPNPPKSTDFRPQKTGGVFGDATKKVLNSAFIRNTHATASWDGGRSSTAYTSNRIHNAAENAHASMRGSGKFASTVATTHCVTMAHRSPYSSSAGTSVESIVPKYSMHTAAPQKRSYNQNKPTKDSSHTVSVSKKQQPQPATISSCTSSTFSSKFPAGMPFENEFYQPHRSNSITSDTASKYSSYSSYDNNYFGNGGTASSGRVRAALPFEDEFMRKPSNEPLYVDFSKEIPRVRRDASSSPPSTPDEHFHGCAQRIRHERVPSSYQKAKAAACGAAVVAAPHHAQASVRRANPRFVLRPVKPPAPPLRNSARMRMEPTEKEPTIFVAIASWTPSTQCAHHVTGSNTTTTIQLHHHPASAAIGDGTESLVSNRLKLYVLALREIMRMFITHSSAINRFELPAYMANTSPFLLGHVVSHTQRHNHIHSRLCNNIILAHTHIHPKKNAEIIPDTCSAHNRREFHYLYLAMYYTKKKTNVLAYTQCFEHCARQLCVTFCERRVDLNRTHTASH